MLPIFMDNHSTTPVDPRVLQEMLPYFTERFGNAASKNHSFGREAEKAVNHARGQVAHLINCDPSEIIFTSGGTESDNIALKGIAGKPGHIITAMTEHKAVLDTAKRLEKTGSEVTYLPVDSDGLVNPADVLAAITSKTILISIMMANNEIGTLQPISEIGKIAKEKGVFFHTDAAQAVGKIPVDVQAMGMDLLALSAHKIYGPKGVGALYVRRKNPKVTLTPLFDGGGHERGCRSGTLNVPGIVGFGKACEICEREIPYESARLETMRERLKAMLFQGLSAIILNGHPTKRLPNNLNISFAHVEGESLMMDIPEIALSSGSACTAGSLEPSYVLRALGISNEMAYGAIRIGLGRFNTDQEVEYAGERIIKSVNKLRALSPLNETTASLYPSPSRGGQVGMGLTYNM
ncbi:MAG: IscS subfamily cysteine desulfurase [Nitrospirae bacterium]|nr:IscS subfamily cysteine desulfurase [Candidatus Troglogloeales bacterium]